MEFSEQQVLEAYNAAPQAIQDSLTDGAGLDFMMTMQKKYSLHVDVTGKVSVMIRDALIGLRSPGSFFTELQNLGIDRELAQTIMQDLNAQVFMNLHDELKSQKNVETTASGAQPIVPAHRASLPPLVPAMQLVEPVVPVSALPGIPAEVTNSTPATQVPLADRTVSPAPSTPLPITSSQQETYAVRTMANDMEAVKEHRAPEPTILPAHHSEPPPASPSIPLPPPPETTVRRSAPPPVNLPGAPLQKSYGIDPYRETPE